MIDPEINDGQSITRTVSTKRGQFPDLEVTYRPALSKERIAFQRKMNSTDAAAIDKAETELIVQHIIAINEQPLGDSEMVSRLRPAIREALVDLVMSYTSTEQMNNAVNLAFGLRLQLIYPEIAARSCEDCQKWLYDDKGPGKFGPRVERPIGVPVPRGPHIKPPCIFCKKIPTDKEPCPSNAVELSPENFEAWQHYKECKAVGEFPTDPIVRHNAAIIADAEALADQVKQSRNGDSFLRSILSVR